MRATQGGEGAGRTLTEHRSPVAVPSCEKLDSPGAPLPRRHCPPRSTNGAAGKGEPDPEQRAAQEQDEGSSSRITLEGLALCAGGILSYNPGVKLLVKPGCPAEPLGIQSSLFIKLPWTFHGANLWYSLHALHM